MRCKAELELALVINLRDEVGALLAAGAGDDKDFGHAERCVVPSKSLEATIRFRCSPYSLIRVY